MSTGNKVVEVMEAKEKHNKREKCERIVEAVLVGAKYPHDNLSLLFRVMVGLVEKKKKVGKSQWDDGDSGEQEEIRPEADEFVRRLMVTLVRNSFHSAVPNFREAQSRMFQEDQKALQQLLRATHCCLEDYLLKKIKELEELEDSDFLKWCWEVQNLLQGLRDYGNMIDSKSRNHGSKWNEILTAIGKNRTKLAQFDAIRKGFQEVNFQDPYPQPSAEILEFLSEPDSPESLV